MRTIALLMVALGLMALPGFGAEVQPPIGSGSLRSEPPKSLAEARERGKRASDVALAYRALDTQFSDDQVLKDKPFAEVLKLLGAAAKFNLILDGSLEPAERERLEKMPVSVSISAGDTVGDVLSTVCAAQGLRYVIAGRHLMVTTAPKAVAAVVGAAEPKAPPVKTSQLLATEEALQAIQEAEGDYGADWVSPRDMIASTPSRIWRRPYRDPVTGIMQFPGPPVWIDAGGSDSPRFWFSRRPYFLKPERLAELYAAQGLMAREREMSQKAFGALLEFMKKNPDMKAAEILEKLGTKTEK